MTDQNQAIEERLRQAPLSHHFPVIFNNGTVVRELVMACMKCRSFYSGDNKVCGRVTKLSPSEYLIEGVGQCSSCSHTSVFDFKIFDDRSIANLVDGEWHTVAADERNEVSREAVEKLLSKSAGEPEQRNPRQKEIMAKLGTVLITLRIVWVGGYIWSIMPALEEIKNGSTEGFLSTFLTNGALIAVGYICSVMLAVNYFRKQ